MATRTKKDSVQLSLTIDGKQAENTIEKLNRENHKLVEQLFDLEAAGKTATEEYSRLKEKQQGVLKQSNELNAQIRAASEQQQRLAVNEGKSLNQLQREYRQLNAIVKNLPPGHKDFNEQVDLLHKKKTKIDEMKKAFGQLRNNVKSVKEDVKQVGLNIGDLVTGGLVTGGIFAAVDLAKDAGAAIAETVEQMTELRRETQQLTGATGEALDSQVIKIQALASTFELEQREVLQAANAVQSEFGGTIEAALDSIENGLLAGAEVSGEFLQNIQEYSVQFAAAGISAEEFIAVSTRAGKEGIFSDKGLDVVKEFGLRIREQTTTTTRAMEAAFGKKFTQELFQNLNDGSIQTVDALKLVSREMNNTEIPAKQLQTVIADVFGGPGEDAGLRYIQSLQDIQTETINLIDPTNEYVQVQMAQLAANGELAAGQNELTKQLEDTGNSLSVLFSRAKTVAINVLVGILGFFEKFSAHSKGIVAATQQFFTNIFNGLKSVFIDLEILYQKSTKLNPFGDTNAEIDSQIAILQKRKGKLASKIPAWHSFGMDNGYNIRYHVQIPKSWLDGFQPEEREAKKTEVREQMDAFLCSPKNNGKAFYFTWSNTGGSNPDGWKIDPIDTKLNDEAYTALFDQSNVAVASGLGIDPTLANIVVEGKLGNASEKRIAYQIHMALDTPRPRQRQLRLLEIIQKINGWDPAIKFGFEDIEITKLDENPTGTQNIST